MPLIGNLEELQTSALSQSSYSKTKPGSNYSRNFRTDYRNSPYLDDFNREKKYSKQENQMTSQYQKLIENRFEDIKEATRRSLEKPSFISKTKNSTNPTQNSTPSN